MRPSSALCPPLFLRPFCAVQHVSALAGGTWLGSGYRQVPGGLRGGIRRFCGRRKDLEHPGKASVRGCEDCAAALAEVHACQERIKALRRRPAPEL